MNIVNLTPHELNIRTNTGNMLNIPVSGIIARCATTKEVIGNIEIVNNADLDSLSVSTTTFGDVENMPKPKENTIYIVSLLVAQQLKHRNDVFTVGEAIRNEHGQIIGAVGLGKV